MFVFITNMYNLTNFVIYYIQNYFSHVSDSKFLEHLNEKRTLCEYHQGMFQVLEYFRNLSGTYDIGKNINVNM